MAVSVLAECKQYLYRYGTATDTTIDPVDLLRDLVRECERERSIPIKVTTKRPPPPSRRAT